MAGAAGPNTAEAGLVFAYDTGNTKTSYIGEPTTNEANSDYLRTIQFHNQGGYNNAGSTADAPEKGPGWKKITITNRGTNFRIAQFPYISQNYGTTKVYSVEYDFGTTSGYFIYGDGSSGFGVLQDTGTRVTARFTPPSAGSWAEALFLGNNTPASGINDVIYYRNYQVEVNTHPTPFTPGTRSATQGLLDLTGASTINLADVSFNSSAQIVFDGTNDKIAVPSNSSNNIAGNITMELILNRTDGYNGVPIHKEQQYTLFIASNGDITYADSSLWSYSTFGYYYSGITAGVFHHVVATKSGSLVTIYVDNNVVISKTFGSAIAQTNNTLYMGSYNGIQNYFAGEIPVSKLYNRALTANEVATNFQALRYRFGI
jgi:hypothetical protein